MVGECGWWMGMRGASNVGRGGSKMGAIGSSIAA
jgi:hypothetical protein